MRYSSISKHCALTTFIYYHLSLSPLIPQIPRNHKTTIMSAKTTYDVIPYTSHPFAQTHPERLATLGRLFGLKPAPVTQCRVLELGCASGGNLIPMAFHLPDSEFLGIDLSNRQVTDAQSDIEALGLKNIRIEHQSILDIDASLGEFDYILCHGVYSWVPEPVQNKILSIAADNLAPHGIAFVSYNVYPGWHMREMVRHMMRFHSSQFDEPHERIEQSRALLNFLSNAIASDNYYGAMLNSELDLLQNISNSYLFHEHLEEINQPIYFHQFAERAKSHGLQYLAEAEFSSMNSSDFSSEVSATLARISTDLIRGEQYMDFVRNRFFRQTLLCHENIGLKRTLAPEDLEGFLVASSLTPETNPAELTPGTSQTFSTKNGRTISTSYPLTKAALSLLGEKWPRAIHIDELVDEARLLLGRSNITGEAHTHRTQLLEDLLSCYAENIIELHTWQGNFTQRISDTPAISELAAHQIRKGILVVNQRHESVELSDLTKLIALALDGKHSPDEVLTHIIQQASEGILNIKHNGELITGIENIEAFLRKALSDSLETLASSAMLTA